VHAPQVIPPTFRVVVAICAVGVCRRGFAAGLRGTTFSFVGAIVNALDAALSSSADWVVTVFEQSVTVPVIRNPYY
jgi:hypothetical protein